MTTSLKNNLDRLSIALLLFLAILDFPYLYYQLLRWFVCGIAVYSSNEYFEIGYKKRGWIFAIIALLFNPLIPFYMQKDSWVIFDIIAGIFFIISSFDKRK